MIDAATRLNQDAEGIWRAAGTASVSYPESGHAGCFEVEDRSFWFHHRNRCIVSLVDRHPPAAGSTLLEIGGGNGAVSAALKDAGRDVALLEPGPRGARNALARGIPTVICATFQDAGFRPESLDAVGLFDVIEHIESDGAFLNDVCSALKRGGRLYATVPAGSWLWSADDELAGHYRRYGRDGFCDLLRTSGFDIDQASYLFWPLPLPLFLIRSVPYRLGARPGEPDAETVSRDHGAGSERTFRLMERMLRPEWQRIRDGKSVPFGTSCLVAAQKS